MDICRHRDGLKIFEVDPFLAELLRQIPESTTVENEPEAKARLFCPPAAKDTEVCREWETYVVPELERLFRSATETVVSDLKQLCGHEKSLANHTLEIPNEHADAWLNTLNQARLAIAARNGFTESELCDGYRSPIGSRRDLSLFQVNFYGFLQELILREMLGFGSNGADPEQALPSAE